MSPEGRSSAWKMWLGCPAPLVQINEEGVLVRQREADLRHFRHGLWCDPPTPTAPRPWRTDWHPNDRHAVNSFVTVAVKQDMLTKQYVRADKSAPERLNSRGTWCRNTYWPGRRCGNAADRRTARAAPRSPGRTPPGGGR